jgi:KTSC domain
MGPEMSRRLDIANVDAALSRAAYKAVHGTREDRLGQYQRVQSTAITSIRYSADTRELDVAFTNGKTYCYSTVPLQVYLEFIDVESKGRFFNEKIKDRFPFSDVSVARR